MVKDYWPEFGRNGKDNVTVEMMLSHQGGLEKAQFKTTFEDIGDHERMSKLLSDMTPTWPPGRRWMMMMMIMWWRRSVEMGYVAVFLNP